MGKMTNWIKKFGGYILSSVGAIGTIAGLLFLVVFKNNKVDDKINQLKKEHGLEKEKLKDENIINGHNYNNYRDDGTIR